MAKKQGLMGMLDGKKSYAVAAVVFVLGGLQALGIVIPEWVYPMLAALGLGALRQSMK